MRIPRLARTLGALVLRILIVLLFVLCFFWSYSHFGGHDFPGIFTIVAVTLVLTAITVVEGAIGLLRIFEGL